MEKKVVIVGAGALGSHVAMLLRNEADLRIVDHDRVEAKNTLSQLHSVKSVGKHKIVVLQQTLNFLFGLRVEAMNAQLGINNVKELLSGTDLVVDCVDNGETRKLIQDYCVINSRPCLHGALSADGAFGQSIWTPGFKVDFGDAGKPTCEDGAHLPFISTVSSLVARSAQAFLRTGKKVGYQVHAGGAVVV